MAWINTDQYLPLPLTQDLCSDPVGAIGCPTRRRTNPSPRPHAMMRPSIIARVSSLLGAAAAVFVVITVVAASRSDAFVYWVNTNTSSVGIATLNGSKSNRRFIKTSIYVSSVAVGRSYVYWTDSRGRIGRAGLNGKDANPNFIVGRFSNQVGQYLGSLATTPSHVYWMSDLGLVAARLDGSDIHVIAGSSELCALLSSFALEGPYLYIGAFGNDPSGDFCCQALIARARIDGTNVQHFLRLGQGPSNLAADSRYLFWTHGSSIGRANLDGSGANPKFLFDVAGPSFVPGVAHNHQGLADDGKHIYWPINGWISRANIDGSGLRRHFIPADDPQAIAVDQRSGPLPG